MRGLGSAGRHGERGLPQDAQHFCRGDPPDPMRLEDAFEGPLADARGFLWRRRRRVQFEKPVGGQVIADRQGLRIIAPQLLTDAVAQPALFLLQFLGKAGPGA